MGNDLMGPWNLVCWEARMPGSWDAAIGDSPSATLGPSNP